MKRASRTAGFRSSPSPDERLIGECLSGNEDAWVALVNKYRRLICSVPYRYGLQAQDAADVFQQVCLQLLDSLPSLRDPKSLPAWLLRTTSHACSRLARREARFETGDFEFEPTRSTESPERMLQQLEQEQLLREVLEEVSARCRELLLALFYESPAVPYAEVAQRLGVATGTIGFMRMRCLASVRHRLDARGFS